jgi:anti-anti-sigma factor
MPLKNRYAPRGRLDRSGPRSRACGTAPVARAGDLDTMAAIRQSEGCDDVIIAVPGTIDRANAAALRLAVIAARTRDPAPSEIVVDLTATTVLDAFGLDTLLVSCLTCAARGVPIIIRNPPPYLAWLLRQAGYPPY